MPPSSNQPPRQQQIADYKSFRKALVWQVNNCIFLLCRIFLLCYFCLVQLSATAMSFYCPQNAYTKRQDILGLTNIAFGKPVSYRHFHNSASITKQCQSLIPAGHGTVLLKDPITARIRAKRQFVVCYLSLSL